MNTAFMPHRRRHPRIAAAALVAYCLIATAVAVYYGQSGHPAHTASVPAKPGIASAPAPSAAHRVAGSSPGSSQAVPSVPDVSLSGLSWRSLQGYEMPVSAQAGPFDTSGGTASGYADTPLGSLVAAINITARTSWQFGPSVFGPTVTKQVTGQFAAQLLSADQNSWSQGAPESTAGTQGTRQVAFAFDQYTPSAASVELVSGVPGAGDYAVTQVQVVWLHGDWRAVAPPGGDWANSAAQVNSAEGFTAFPGQGG